MITIIILGSLSELTPLAALATSAPAGAAGRRARAENRRLPAPLPVARRLGVLARRGTPAPWQVTGTTADEGTNHARDDANLLPLTALAHDFLRGVERQYLSQLKPDGLSNFLIMIHAVSLVNNSRVHELVQSAIVAGKEFTLLEQ